MSLQIQTTRVEPDIVVVHLSGGITSGPEGGIILEPLFSDLLNQNVKKLIFDLSGVEQVDSFGASVIIHCFLAARRAGGGLCLAGATAKVARLFQITLLDAFLHYYPIIAAACEGFSVTPNTSE